MALLTASHTLQAGALYNLCARDVEAVFSINLSFEFDGQIRYMALPIDEVRTFYIETAIPVTITCPAGVELTCMAQGGIARVRSVWLKWTNGGALRLTEPAGVTLYPVPTSPRVAKLFRRSLNICRLLDISPERSYAPEDHHMLTGQVDALASLPQITERSRIAVLLHLHYVELWPEFAGYLAHIPLSFCLIVTLTANDPEVIADIVNRFPQADVRVMANFGRDLGPFLTLLDEGVFDRFDYVCKLHGKKSVRNGKPTLLGDMWRRRSVMELLGSAQQIDAVLAQFEADPRLGMAGPAAFRIPNARFSAHDAWGGNRAVTLALASRIRGEAVEAEAFPLDFFAGTMFWFRPPAFDALRPLKLGQAEVYATEAGHTDGALEHALERALAYAVKQADYTVASVPSVF